MSHEYSVAIVVVPAFDQLAQLVAQMPVWIVETPHNRAAAEKHWANHPSQSHTEGVTTFRVDASRSPEAWCAGILSSLDLHHGEYSHNPPYTAVEVFGVLLTPVLERAFREFGFGNFMERPGGFRAAKADAV